MCQRCPELHCVCDLGESAVGDVADGTSLLDSGNATDCESACGDCRDDSQQTFGSLCEQDVTNNSLLEQQKCRTLRRVARLIRNKRKD